MKHNTKNNIKYEDWNNNTEEKGDEVQEEQKKPKLQYHASYILAEGEPDFSDDPENIIERGEASIILDKEEFNFLPDRGVAILFSYRSVSKVSVRAYKLQLLLDSGESLLIYNLGYNFESFCMTIFNNRNELIIKDMLVNEASSYETKGEFQYFSEAGYKAAEGNCLIRLYETAVVLMKQEGELFRIPFCYVTDVEQDNYCFRIRLENGECYVLCQMGRHFDAFTRQYFTAVNSLNQKIQVTLNKLLPKADFMLLRKASRYIRDGRAASKEEIESVSRLLWSQLERTLVTAGLGEQYDFFKKLGCFNKSYIGIKRGLMGELTGEYIWFVMPFYNKDKSIPGNAVILEAGAGDGGKATYFFRMMNRSQYRDCTSQEELELNAEKFVKKLNYALYCINFRREPIYISDERLELPENIRYKIAVKNLPQLQILRQHYIGRVLHRSKDQWERDVYSLLSFNISAETDDIMWKGAGR